ncbi:MAG: FGGY-family carbohydrate kinase [Acidimicrobiales bacterium]
MAPSPSSAPLVAGIDLATADVRVAVADERGRVVARGAAPLAAPDRPRPGVSEQDAGTWWPAVTRALREALDGLEGRVTAVAVSATSGTVVLADGDGEPVGPALLYDDGRVPADQRWDWLVGQPGAAETAVHAWHASDLVVARLTGEPGPTDWSHALKTGYDPAARRWGRDDAASALRPEVRAPASPAGTVGDRAAADTGLPSGSQVRLGMTDGCAAQVGAGADRPGRFVSVLGTTLVVKGASEGRIDDPGSGVYSHRHPDGWWLPGGASNTGGGSLAGRFPHHDLADLDRKAALRGPATAVCYPLQRTGERFPFVAPDAEELWTGEPADEVDAYRAVLEGVAFVERLAFERLGDLGAPLRGPLRAAGAGSRSPVWTAIRATVLGVPVVRPESADTVFGACVLAAAGTVHESLTAATDAMVAISGPEVEPVGDEHDRLEASYERFVAALVERGWLEWRS